MCYHKEVGGGMKHKYILQECISGMSYLCSSLSFDKMLHGNASNIEKSFWAQSESSGLVYERYAFKNAKP